LKEATNRLSEYGPNQLPEPKTRSPFLRFLYQFHNVLIYVLMITGVVTALLEHWVDSSVIFGVVLLNALIGFVQEGKAVTLALSLALEPPEQKVMRRPPRKSHEPMLTLGLVWRVVFVSFILMGGTFGLFLWEMGQGVSIEHARTVAVNTLVMFEVFYLFNSRYIAAPVFNWAGLTGNRYVLIAVAILMNFQLAFTYLPPMQTLFGTTAIDVGIWLRILLVSSSVLFLVELEKAVIRHMNPTGK